MLSWVLFCFTKKAKRMIFPVAFYQYAFRRVGRPHWTPFPAQPCGVCAVWIAPCGLSMPSTPCACLPCALVPNFPTGSGWEWNTRAFCCRSQIFYWVSTASERCPDHPGELPQPEHSGYTCTRWVSLADWPTWVGDPLGVWRAAFASVLPLCV